MPVETLTPESRESPGVVAACCRCRVADRGTGRWMSPGRRPFSGGPVGALFQGDFRPAADAWPGTSWPTPIEPFGQVRYPRGTASGGFHRGLHKGTPR